MANLQASALLSPDDSKRFVTNKLCLTLKKAKMLSVKPSKGLTENYSTVNLPNLPTLS